MEYRMLYVECRKQLRGRKEKNQLFNCRVPKKTLNKVSYLLSVGRKNTWQSPLFVECFLYRVFSVRHSATSVFAKCLTENSQCIFLHSASSGFLTGRERGFSPGW
jgi:hypothetical protein